ncbi:MAG: hypothetical protein GXP40_10600 [Chloroflexi bacterium]|nr:hypothetical protein [Chloroflexota bacterium]
MNRTHTFFLGIALLGALFLGACNVPTDTPPSAPQVEELATPVVSDTTPPEVVMAEIPDVAYYNVGSCTPAPMVWSAQITDDKHEILNAEVQFRFSDEQGNTISTTYNYFFPPVSKDRYELSLLNSDLENDIAAAVLGNGAGIFEYKVVATDEWGNKQYFPSENGWAQISLLPCAQNADMDPAGDTSANNGASNTSGAPAGGAAANNTGSSSASSNSGSSAASSSGSGSSGSGDTVYCPSCDNTVYIDPNVVGGSGVTNVGDGTITLDQPQPVDPIIPVVTESPVAPDICDQNPGLCP